GDDRERLERLGLTCIEGLVDAELTAEEDELENDLLAARVEWRGEEMPLRTAQAQLAVLPAYADREELGARQVAVSAGFNNRRREVLEARASLDAELVGE